MEIPLNVPVCLKAHTGNNIQNQFIFRTARCNNQNTQAWEQILLLKTDDNKIIIQSRWNNQNLRVRRDGCCIFDSYVQDICEKFDVECDEDGKVYFISCHTGKVMQCDPHGNVRCDNTNRMGWEAWTIIDPDTAEMMTSKQLRTISFGFTSLLLSPFIGPAARVVVSTLDAVIPPEKPAPGSSFSGVSTYHVPLKP